MSGSAPPRGRRCRSASVAITGSCSPLGGNDLPKYSSSSWSSHKHSVLSLQPTSEGSLCARLLLGGPSSSQGPLAEGPGCHLRAELVLSSQVCALHLWHEISAVNCPGEEAALSAV